MGGDPDAPAFGRMRHGPRKNNRGPDPNGGPADRNNAGRLGQTEPRRSKGAGPVCGVCDHDQQNHKNTGLWGGGGIRGGRCPGPRGENVPPSGSPDRCSWANPFRSPTIWEKVEWGSIIKRRSSDRSRSSTTPPCKRSAVIKRVRDRDRERPGDTRGAQAHGSWSTSLPAGRDGSK